MTQAEQVERRGGRPRSEDVHRAIIAATLDLLAEVGLDALSIEGVAARAEVGKTTIYRRWPNKEALVVEAVATLKGPVPEPAGHSLREDLVTLMHGSGRGREDSRRRRLYSTFVAEMSRHPDLARRFVDTVIEPRREAVRRVLRAAMARGELRDDLDIDLMLHMVMAPILHWTSHHPDEPLERERILAFLDASLEGLGPR